MISWPIKWKYGDRIFLTGPSGCGKTTVLKVVARQKGNVLVIDTKHSDEDGFDEVGDVVNNGDLRRIREGRFVWRADRDFVLEPEAQSKFFFAALDSGPRALVIDEGYNLLGTPGQKLFVTQCRGKKVSLLLGAQRPSGLSLHIVFNANYYIVFYLPSEDDRKRIEKATGQEPVYEKGTGKQIAGVPWDKLRKVEHSFMVYNDKGDSGGPFRLKI